MLNIRCWLYNWNRMSIIATLMPLTVGIAVVTNITAPVSAQVAGGRGMTTEKIYIPPSQPATNQGDGPASYIYGSPIPTPIPVNPNTGQSYRSGSGNRTVVNSTPPVLVNPSIQDSTLINPVIINQPGYRTPEVYQRYPGYYYPYSY